MSWGEGWVEEKDEERSLWEIMNILLEIGKSSLLKFVLPLTILKIKIIILHSNSDILTRNLSTKDKLFNLGNNLPTFKLVR